MILDCPHLDHCGGCTRLRRSIGEQLRQKRDSVQDLLAPWLSGQGLSGQGLSGQGLSGQGLSGQGIPVPACERTPRHDRMRILYPVQPGAGGRLSMGIFEPGSHRVVEISHCELQHPALTTLGQRALAIFRQHGLEPYDEARQEGFLRAFSARIAPGTGECLLGLVTRSGPWQQGPKVAAALRAACQDLQGRRGRRLRLVGILRNLHDAPGNKLLGPEDEMLWGRDHLLDREASLHYRISFLSFYQLHRRASSLLYRPALAMLGDLEGLAFVDAYGGVGSFALRLAAAGARSVTLVEQNPIACADARYNAEHNALPQVRVEEGDFAGFSPQTAIDLLVADPSRAGLTAAAVARVQKISPPRMLYVSCAPSSLARDLEALGSYGIQELRLADLFPHTEHIEVLALLRLRSG